MGTGSMTFVPLGGLCNRMRAMASGVYLAKALDNPVTFYWEKNRDCYADFSELFKPIAVDGVLVKPFRINRFYLSADRKRNLYLPGKIRSLMFDRQVVGRRECLDEQVPENLEGRAFLISGYSLSAHYSIKDLFVPTDDIQRRIYDLSHRFSPEILGVHIRRKDNRQSIAKNSLEDYYRFMDLKIHETPSIGFYLATDEPEVKTEMLRHYSDRVLTHDALLERTSSQGMKDAVVDLWCLSLTNGIIGSYYSSYSDIAAELGDVGLTIV